MSYTFICTPQKTWWLKLTTMEQLQEYWKQVFDPKMQQTLSTISDTREYGNGQHHCDNLHDLIGVLAQHKRVSFTDSHSQVLLDMRTSQEQALRKHGTIYINRDLGWNVGSKEVEQFVHRNSFDFPVMKADRVKIERFPYGTHYYVFIDGVQLRCGNDVKFATEQEALKFAQKYISSNKSVRRVENRTEKKGNVGKYN